MEAMASSRIDRRCPANAGRARLAALLGRLFGALVTVSAASFALVTGASAQEFPTRQIVIVVPFPAGGSTDALARILAEPMRVALGQPVLVQNVPGAGATIGIGRVVQAAPDGYTLSLGNWTSHVGGSGVYPVPWHVVNDLEPISLLSTSTLMIVGRSGLPVNDGKQFIAWLKANPDQATAAIVGQGSGAHVCSIYLAQKTGTRFRYIPYRGGAPVMADLLANQVDFFCAEASQTLPHLRSGKMKPLIVMSKKRWSPMPDVPTMEELGASDTHIAFWHGLWAPKGTPKQVVAKLTDAVVKAFADPMVIKRLGELGHDLPTREQMTPAALAAHHKSEIDKWWPVIKEANIKAE
jgi:tripartite-type tricarboxylate transporter receptor subunit TctC